MEGDRGPGAGDATQIASVCLSAAAPARHTWGGCRVGGGLKKASPPEGERVSPLNTALANTARARMCTLYTACQMSVDAWTFSPVDGRNTDSRVNNMGTRHQGALAGVSLPALFFIAHHYINLPR